MAKAGFHFVQNEQAAVLVGLFSENELYQVDILKNTETIFYSRNDDGELVGINKTLSSSIRLLINNRQIEDIYYFKQIDGNLFPEADFPENVRQLRGFNWRGDERLETKEDLFKGEPPLELPEIRGLEVPKEEKDFFENEKGRSLLNKNSRLESNDLQEEGEDQNPPAEIESMNLAPLKEE